MKFIILIWQTHKKPRLTVDYWLDVIHRLEKTVLKPQPAGRGDYASRIAGTLHIIRKSEMGLSYCGVASFIITQLRGFVFQPDDSLYSFHLG